MSTQKGFQGWGVKCRVCLGNDENCQRCAGTGIKPGDEKLLAYLMQNRHETPFEMAGMVVEVQAPIMVFREWHRHRVPWSYNEASARYAPLPALDFLPSVKRMMRGQQGHATKQAASHVDVELTEQAAKDWLERLEKIGVPGAPIHDLQQAADQPQTQALGIFQDIPGADLRVVGLPVSFDGARPPVRSRAPELGQHNEAFGLPPAPLSHKETP